MAAARRKLPPGGEVREDYVFQGRGEDGHPIDVRLSDLFRPGRDSLVVYNMMFPRHPLDDRPGPASGETALLPLAEGPCPSCTALLDQLEGVVEHSTPLLNLVVVAKAPLDRIATFARERGWRRLRLLSSAATVDDRFEYIPPPTCRVPNLKGKTLKAARKGAGSAGCSLGRVSKKSGATAKSGKVAGQSPKAGTIRPQGAKIAIILR